MPQRQFNLIDEGWIPVSGGRFVGLKTVFSDTGIEALEGNPTEKAAVFKLLQAIGEAACKLKTEEDWNALSFESFQQKCLGYLAQWHDRFDLYGERPFLQMPAVARAECKSYGALNPETATGNATVLTQFQVERSLSDAERALLLVRLMGFAPGGKKTDNSVILAEGYTGKSKAGKPGPSLGFLGALHSFAFADNVVKSVWLNLMTEEQVLGMKIYPQGVGVAPWEEMPVSEDCPVARRLKQSLMGRLVPMCRFCLFSDEGVHYTEGVQHPTHMNGVYDPSMTVRLGAKDLKVIWTDPQKRPWRSLAAILSFLSGTTSGKDHFDCRQLAVALTRVRRTLGENARISVWSGGLRVSSNAGEQYVAGSDDYVASELSLTTECISQTWFLRFADEIGRLDVLAKHLYGSVLGYCTDFKAKGADRADQAVRAFWKAAEQEVQNLVDACADGNLEDVRALYGRMARAAYDEACPHETPRQVIAWVRHIPNTSNKSKKHHG